MADEGFLYIAVGEKYLKEALISAQQLNRVMPEYPITIVTHRELEEEYFDSVVVVDSLEKYSEKVVNMRMPYERTLFVDMDTWIVSPVDELFDLLDQFDIALSHNPGRNYDKNEEVPEGFPQHNTGVIAMRKNSRTKGLLERWGEEYKRPEEPDDLDQTSFRKALYESNCRFTVLPPEYNCRYNRPGAVQGEVKIFHGRILEGEHGIEKRVEIEEAINKINSFGERRAHVVRSGKIKIYKTKYSIFQAIKKTIRREGILKTVEKTIKKIPEIATGKWGL